ncbi:hypothetical protein GCM10010466_09080 [Planomonospora alba]|uniref:Uncharacterized protein n=1 Tax=Planomonospora alba TaxID=161354 RepID=A0ABP6MNE0_9ACTN
MSTDLHETTDPSPSSPLDVAERIFQLLARAPGGLTVNGVTLPDELPRCPIPLGELRDLLAGRPLSPAARDAVWRDLVIRARLDGSQWLAAAVGVAVPALRDVAGRVRWGYATADPADVEAQVLTAFVAAVRTADIDRPSILPRLCEAARRAGERARRAAESDLAWTLFAAEAETTEIPAITPSTASGEAEEETPMTSARSRISSDPQPTITEPKGGRGNPTGSARSPYSPTGRPQSLPARRITPGTRARRERRMRLSRHVLRALVVSGITVAVLAVAAVAVLADGGTTLAAATPSGGTRAVRAPASPDQLGQVFENMRNWIIGLLATLATLMLTIGGLRYLVAGGDPGEVQKAKAALKAAAMGYALAVLAPIFVSILKRVVGG